MTCQGVNLQRALKADEAEVASLEDQLSRAQTEYEEMFNNLQHRTATMEVWLEIILLYQYPCH